MHIVGFIFFLSALFLSLAVVAQMLVANRGRIFEALLGEIAMPETTPPTEVIYLPVRQFREIEWRKAA